MLNLRINPLVAKDLKEIRDYIAEDNVLNRKLYPSDDCKLYYPI